MEQLLQRDKSPRLVGSHSRLTVVEFGDAQCPYCRQFADWYQTLPPELLDSTTLVFKHMPLPQHSWARTAADYSACAGQQTEGAFWALTNYLLTHQGEVNSNNANEKILRAAAQVQGISVERLQMCVAAGTGSSLVQRDISVANDLSVNSTPTLFIHGRRAPALTSKEDLVRLLIKEMEDHAAGVSAGGQ